MRHQRLTLVDLESDLDNLAGLMCMPRFGLSVIGSVLANAGHSCTILADAYGPVTVEEIVGTRPDAVLFNGIKTTLHRVREYAGAVRAALPDVPIILGGEEATLSPGSGDDIADVIVLGEGDGRAVDIVAALGEPEALRKIPGLRMRVDDRWHETPPAARMDPVSYRLEPSLYRGAREIGTRRMVKWFDFAPGGRLPTFPIQTSRGCNRLCSFCTWMKLFGGRGYVERDLDEVMHDIDAVVTQTGLRRFMLIDNLFGLRKAYTLELVERILQRYPAPRKRPLFMALMRADQFGDAGYTDAEIALLRRAGFKDIILGLESVNQETLRLLKKGIEIADYVGAIGKLRAQGVRVCGSFGVGGGIDDMADIRRIPKLARTLGLYRLHLYAFSLFPGVPAAKKDAHLIIHGVEPRYLNGHAAVIFPRRLLPSELQEGLLDAMDAFYRWHAPEGFFYKRKIRSIRSALQPHLAHLKKLERTLVDDGVYVAKSDGWLLDEGRLRAQCAIEPASPPVPSVMAG